MDPKLLNAAVAAVSVLSLCSCRQTPVSIVPQPVVAEENCSSFRLSPDSLLVYSGDEALLDLAGVWAETLEKHYAPGTVGLPDGFTRIVSDIVLPAVRVTDDPRKADVVLSMDPALAEEEYTLEISRRGINVTGGTARGVWWGIQTLDQVLVQSASASSGKAKIRVRGLHVQDKPHFAYRGAHFDPCRHFFTVDELKTFIDMLALHKLNTLHWHLTDDQGWRLEIEKYPLLTEVGAVRKETKIGLYSDKEAGYDGTPYGEGGSGVCFRPSDYRNSGNRDAWPCRGGPVKLSVAGVYGRSLRNPYYLGHKRGCVLYRKGDHFQVSQGCSG